MRELRDRFEISDLLENFFFLLHRPPFRCHKILISDAVNDVHPFTNQQTNISRLPETVIH